MIYTPRLLKSQVGKSAEGKGSDLYS